MSKLNELAERLEQAKRHERHGRVAETRYWCDQYKQLAQAAIAELNELKQQGFIK